MASPSARLEPFPPAPDDVPSDVANPQASPTRPAADSNASKSSQTVPRRPRASSAAASIASTASSVTRSILDADLPPGFLAATGAAASKAPSLSDIRRGSYGNSGWNKSAQRRDRRQSSDPSSPISSPGQGQFPPLTEEDHATATGGASHSANGHTIGINDVKEVERSRTQASKPETSYDGSQGPDPEKNPVNAELVDPVSQRTSWVEPPPLPWTTSFMIGLRTYLKWVITIPGFLITVYGLNIVAWGGMLFLLLCNAAPAMCKPSCNDINSPRRIWIEIDSQILNALFCVTGFGLAPWRFRDLYWWGYWRLGRKEETKLTGIRRLAGVHKNWFRLPGSDQIVGDLDPTSAAVPIPSTKAPAFPLTGIRAPPTTGWKMDWVVLMNVSNTFLQTVLSGFMWGLDRYDRPSWSTGLFVALACGVAGLGGWMIFQEGKKVKKVEGAPIGEEERKARGWPAEDIETALPPVYEHAEQSNAKEEKKGLKKGPMRVGRAGG